MLVSTGEVYAVELNGLDRFAVLGRVEPTREAAEEALKGWADGEMTLLNLAGRFGPVAIDDPLAEAADVLKRCGSALRRIRVACNAAQRDGDITETLAFINTQLCEAGFPPGDEDLPAD